MRLLAIDPALRKSGFAILEKEGRTIRALAHGVIRNRTELSLTQCLLEIHRQTDQLIAQYLPECCAVESVIFVQNSRTAVTLRAARGSALLAAAQHGLSIFEYPIIDLRKRGKDLHRFLRTLEQSVIRLVEAFHVPDRREEGKTGVWVEDRKIASIGIGVRRWITMHGFALNVSSDLTGFLSITPCGLTGVRMTSLSLELGREVTLEEVRDQAALVLEAEFGEAAVVSGER